MDFVNNLDTDTSLSILSCLDDPSDIVRASAVSRSWRQFGNLIRILFNYGGFAFAVVKYSLSKNLCLKLFHQLSNVDHIIETSNDRNGESSEAGSSSLMDTRLLEKEHRAFALLARGCMSSPIESCIADAIRASSTDNYPVESILNTLEKRDRIGRTPSYWSSTGQHKTTVPESLLYKLIGDLCLITEVSIHPFQGTNAILVFPFSVAYFQRGHPIYSSHYVRFRLGHEKDNSPHYNNSQDKKGKSIAELSASRTCSLHCVSHVKVEGRSLAKSFRVENVDDNGKFGLKVLSYNDPKKMEEMDAEAGQDMDAEAGQSQLRNLEQLLNLLHRHPLDVVDYVWPDESDDEYAESEDEAEP
nr:A_TM018A10.10 gene product [Arabidopsis thaliana]